MHSICIALLNWNRQSDLNRLLLSVIADVAQQNASGYRYEIIVIDNASTDDSIEMVNREFPSIRVVANVVNLGGSGGYNTALRFAVKHRFDFIWLLDNDAEVLPGALQGLLDAILLDDKVAIVGSKILHRDDPRVVSELGADINLLTTFPIPRYQNIPSKLINMDINTIDVDYVAICSALVRINVLTVTGLLDESFFLMWDDMEWGLRFRQFGYRVIATSKSSVIHPGFSERSISPTFVYYAWRNHLYFIAATYSGVRRYIYLCFISGLLHAGIKKNERTAFNIPYAHALKTAFLDFWSGNFGQCRQILKPLSLAPTNDAAHQLSDSPTILLSADRPVSTIRLALHNLKERFPDSRFVILAGHHRRHLFSWHNPQDLLIRNGLIGDFILSLRIKLMSIETAIIFQGTHPSILLSVPRHCWTISDTGIIINSKTSTISSGIKNLFLNRIDFILGFVSGAAKTICRIYRDPGIENVSRSRKRALIFSVHED